ncbi:hypothetical protein [Tenacibaculum agarivorans]|uniref:hypothetical protein n=1 Tax=Tenacibaculum agarivorans TaxID=1908389 RepID=UPI00094BB20D|nr:hypothetical protein [Tenacibaculum agarivorans]
MKFNLILILITATVQGQNVGRNLFGKTFSANVNSVCEETPIPDPCAGEQIYILVKLTKDKIELTEKGISSCEKETYVHSYIYDWKLEDNEIIVNSNPKEIQYTYLNKLKLRLKSDKLFGLVTYDNGKVIEYELKEEIQ